MHPLDDLMNRIWDGVIPGICFGIWSVIALDPATGRALKIKRIEEILSKPPA